MTTPFLEQGPSAFLEQPSFLEVGQLPAPAPRIDDDPDFLKVAVGVAAAIVVLRLIVRSELSREQPMSREEVDAAAGRIWKRVLPTWLRASVPAVAQAYKLGSTGNVSYDELETMATLYAEEMGEYVHSTSMSALAEGFGAQVNSGWNKDLAWIRSREAYGLDSNQMRSYVKGLMSTKEDYPSDPIPSAARAAVDRAFLYRADRLGTNEAFKASQVGRNMVWLTMETNGDLPAGTKKRWVTAADERVCPVCGPLHMVTIPLHRRFESNGMFFHAPGVHPNCRCELELVYPELGNDVSKAAPGDKFNRDEEGQFARVESRQPKKAVRLTPKTVTRQRVKISESEQQNIADLLSGDEAVLDSLRTADLNSLRTADLASIAEGTASLESLRTADLTSLMQGTTTTVVHHRRTSDPLKSKWHNTQAWIAVNDAMLDALGYTPDDLTELGLVLDFEDVGQDLAIDGSQYLLGYSVPEPTYVDDNPAFNRAFDQYMTEDATEVMNRNRQATVEDDERAHLISNFRDIEANVDLYSSPGGLAAAKSMSAKDREYLREQVALAVISLDGQEILDRIDSPLANDTAFMTTASGSEIASEIVRAYIEEAKLGVIGPWHDVILRSTKDQDESIDSVLRESQILGMEGSSRGKVTPVIFVLDEWYGVEEDGVPGPGDTFAPSMASITGKYEVRETSYVPGRELPPAVYSDERADAVDRVLIVHLEPAQGR